MTSAECREIIEKAAAERATELDLSRKELKELPAEISRLTNLTSLDLSSNKLTQLPPEISRLTQLTSLALSFNQLTQLPPEISRLTNLTEIYLNGNRLTQLPPEITRLTQLSLLDLRNNKGLDLPPEIIEKSRDAPAILRYIEQISEAREEEKRPLNEAKMLLVGEGGVGKTSLVNMLVTGRCNPAEQTTEGIAIQRWPIQVADETVHLNIWDFGGQEIYHATHQFFLTKRSLYLLILNAREGETRGRLDYWLKIISSFGGDSPVIVVSNWSDEHRLDLNRRDLHRKYPNRIQGFVDTACLRALKGDPGQNGIDALRKHIENAVSGLKHIRNPLLTRWFEVKRQLEEMQENYITESRYVEMCKTAGIDDKRDQDLLLGYLNDLGVVFTFRDDRRLKDTNILNPEWVTQGIYRILNSSELFQAQGVLKREQLAHILDPAEYPVDKHDFLIGMMRKFELCLRFEDREDQYLIPDLLPKQEPVLNWEEKEALAWEFHYDVLPGSVLSRFIVRTSHLLPKKRLAYWRSGVVLDIEGNRARVKADTAAGRITVSILGREPGRHRALGVIRPNFAQIHETIPGINVEEKVPVPNQTCKPVDYNYLLKLQEKRIEQFLPEGGEEQVSVAWLLEGIETPRADLYARRERLEIEPQMHRPAPAQPVTEGSGAAAAPALARGPQPERAEKPQPVPSGKSPWSTGSFYLFTVLVVFATLAVGASTLGWNVTLGIATATALIAFSYTPLSSGTTTNSRKQATRL